MSSSELHIHGHSCLEIRTEKTTLICDPWLAGSTYWRSWWNFPKSPDLDSLLDLWSEKDNLFIYITHLHWDHFHGPTIRKILKRCKNSNFIIPKTPELRLINDLKGIIGKKFINEIGHTKSLELEKELSISSFQFGPFIGDSILSINSKGINILNMNDAKIMKLSLAHLLSIIEKPNYVLRSHSSANCRCCFRDLDGNLPKIYADKTRLDYSKEFFDACYATGAETAIPFASNMACLHKETYQYNSILNFSDYVEKDFKKVKSIYKGMDCKLILPSEKLILETKTQVKNKNLRESIQNQPRDLYLRKYQTQISNILNKQYELEDSEKISEKLIIKYFSKIINQSPFLVRSYLSNKIYIEVYSKNKTRYFNIDFTKRNVKEVFDVFLDKDVLIVKVHAFVINDVCKKSHWNSLGVSKRLIVRKSPNNKRFLVFNILCNTIECGGFFPLKNIFNYRFISIWLTRFREILDLAIFFFLGILNKKSTNEI